MGKVCTLHTRLQIHILTNILSTTSDKAMKLGMVTLLDNLKAMVQSLQWLRDISCILQ